MATGTVKFKLVSLDEVELRPGETLQLARHRLVMLVYLVLVVVLVVLNINGTTRELPLELRAPVYIVGACVGTLVIVAALMLGESGARKGRDVAIPASPVFFICALSALTSGEGLSMLVVAGPPMSFVQGLLLVVFYYILTEIVVGLTVHYIFPVALAEIRGQAQADAMSTELLPTPTALPPLAGMAKAGNGAQIGADGGATVVPLRRAVMVRIGNRYFDAAYIIRIKAEGNYVRVVTQNERQLLPGPFSAVVAQMPPASGRQISRSGWVATTAVVHRSRIGRDLFLHLTDGEEVRVAAGRQDQLRDWIDGFREAPQKSAR